MAQETMQDGYFRQKIKQRIWKYKRKLEEVEADYLKALNDNDPYWMRIYDNRRWHYRKTIEMLADILDDKW